MTVAVIDRFNNQAELDEWAAQSDDDPHTLAAFLAQDDPSVDPTDVTDAISVPTAATPAEPSEEVA